MNAFISAILNRSRTVLTAMTVLSLAGLFFYFVLPREADPDIDIPVFYISIPFPGISPEDSERLIIKPMESELRSLEGLDEMTSIASQHHAGIILEFEVDFNKDAVLADIRNKVDLARAEIPADAEEPEIIEFNTSLFPVLLVTLSGDVPDRTLFTAARRLQDLLETIPTVLEARLAGHREELLEVLADPVKVEAYNLNYEQLIGTVTRNNLMIAAGQLNTGTGEFAVKLPGLIETAQDLFDIPLITNEAGTLTLGDIASVRKTFKDRDVIVRFNGKPAIAIQIFKRLGSNIVETTETVRAYVNRASEEMPDNIEIGFNFDASSWIHRTLSSLQASITAAILLVMIVVVATLGLRSGSLVGIAIPISFMITFLLLAFGELTINMMVMFGLVLSVGLLVDGAIIIVEYADRKMAEGLDRKAAFTLASQRMFFPIISSTGTTLAAFIPLLLWPGVSGQFMSFLPITLILVLSASLVTALVFLPVIGSLIGKTTASKQQRARLSRLAGDEGDDEKISVGGLTGLYIKMLRKLITKPLTVFASAIGICICVTVLFSRFGNGVEFFVQLEPEWATVFISARGNLSTERKAELTRDVEKVVASIKDVQDQITFIGASSEGGGPTSSTRNAPSDTISYMLIELAPYHTRRRGEVVLDDIRQRTKAIPGIYVQVQKQEEGPPSGKDIQIEITGDNRDHLFKVTKQIYDYIDNNVEGVAELEDTRPLPGIEWVIDIDREIASRYGSDVALVGAAVQLVTDGILISNYRPDDSDEEVEIRLRFPQEYRGLAQLDRLRLPSANGAVPVSNFITRRAQQKVDTIQRIDGRRRTLIKASTTLDPVTGSKILSSVKTAEIGAWLEKQDFGGDIQWRFRGANEEQSESAAFLGKAMIAALFLMFLILITQFNSFYQAMVTLTTVVLSVMGVLVGMMVTGHTFSVIMTGTGIMALAGIVVNNSIVLIDTFNRLKRDIPDRVEAVLRTAAQRLRPILLTTITTMVGLLPMALQLQIDFFGRTIAWGGVVSLWWVQMATAIIFGLGFSTLITLILTPTLLAAPEVLGNRIKALIGKKDAPKEIAAA